MRQKNLLLIFLFFQFVSIVVITKSQQQDTVQTLYLQFNQAANKGDYEVLPSLEKAIDEVLKNEKVLSVEQKALAYALAGSLRQQLSKSDTALILLNKALPLCEEAFGKTADETLEVKRYLSYAYSGVNNLDMERKYSFELLDYYKTDENKYAIQIADLYNTVGQNYGLVGDKLAEQAYLTRSKSIMEAYSTPNDSLKKAAQLNLINIYNSLSVSYRSTNDLTSAMLYARKSLVLREVYTPGSLERAINWMIIGQCFYLAEDNFDSSIFYLDKAINLFETAGMKGLPAWSTYKAYKADILLKASKVNEAITELKSSIDYSDKAGQPNILAASLAKTYNALARMYVDSSNYTKAIKTYEQANNIIKQAGGITPIYAAVFGANYATGLSLTNQWLKAGQEFDSVLNKSGQPIAQLKNPANKIPETIPFEFLNVYRQAGNYLVQYGFASKNNQNILVGIRILQKIAKETDRRKTWYFEAGIDEGIGGQDAPVYDDLLNALYNAKGIMPEEERMAAAFDVIELSKVSLLKNRLLDEKLLSSALPDTVNRKRLALKAELNRLKGSLGKDIVSYDSLAAAKETYMSFVREAKKKYFVTELKEKEAITVTDKALTNHEGAIVNYFLGPKYLYSFIHQNGQQKFIKKNVDTAFKKNLALLRTNCLSQKLWDHPENVKDLSRISKQWYQWLLSDIDTKGELVIIPHKELSLISFEMLDAGNEHQPKYLLESTPVRYELSAGLMCNNETGTKNSKAFFGGFASSNFDVSTNKLLASNYALTDVERDSSETLEGTALEVKQISEITGGDAYTNVKPDDFLNHAADYNILHIATHAFANRSAQEECNLLFETDAKGNNIVSDVKISSLKLNAHLAVLSACNTGLGKMHNGEGMISLARSFFIAGCPSVVMSLWSVNDISTAKIMTGFYRHLQSGETKSEALRNAKLDYLKAETNPARKHPYYWAGFVVVGDNSPLVNSRTNWTFWSLGGGLLFALTGLFFYFRKRPKSSADRLSSGN